MIKRNKLPEHEGTQRKFKHILLSERIWFEKATYCVISLMTFWKRQNYENCKRIRVPGVGGQGRNGLSTENFHANENTLYDSIMMDMLVQTRRPYNTKSELQDKLWNVGHIICQCRFISYNKCTIWWRIFTAGESAYVEQQVFEKSLSLFNFSGNINLLTKKKKKPFKNP